MLMYFKNKDNVKNMEDKIKIFMAGLKKWTKLNNVTQKELCKVINKDQTTVSNYYKNKTRPTHDTIQKIINHYNLDYEEILEAGRSEKFNQSGKTNTQKKDTHMEEQNRLLRELVKMKDQRIEDLEKRLEVKRGVVKSNVQGEENQAV